MSQPLTMPDAVLDALRDSVVAGTVGDTYDPAAGTGLVKIGFDYLGPNDLPYVVIQEPGESRTYFTDANNGPRPFLGDGMLSIACFAGDRKTVLDLADQVARALHDAPLSWADKNAMKILRAVESSAVPIPDVGPDSPTIFGRVVTMQFMYQGAI